MKILIMGSGVVGVLSAYFLARDGHEVTVIEKNPKSAMGCSFANGGQLSFSHIEPFSSKSSISLIAKSLLKLNSFSLVENLFSKELLKFYYDFLKNYGTKKTKIISENLFNLGQTSRFALEEILSEENINFCHSKKGILHFYKNPKLFDRAMQQAEFQASLGDDISILDASQCVNLEPTLVKLYDEKRLLGGILHNNDGGGNAYIFCQKLTQICQKKYGVKFEFNTEIKNIFTNYKKITGVNTNKQVFVADKYLFCLGAYGNKLLEGIDIKSKIMPVKGYSLSIPCDDDFLAPKIGLTDPENKIVYSRLNNIFRAAGTVEISNSIRHNKELIDFLRSKIEDSFSDYGNLNDALKWQGVRPFRPNSTPLIKKSDKYPNLIFNSGHGHLGWTMSFGSAKVVSDLIKDKKNSQFDFLKQENC